jgi:sporulation protein YlmC with PRC-barrel domain
LAGCGTETPRLSAHGKAASRDSIASPRAAWFNVIFSEHRLSSNVNYERGDFRFLESVQGDPTMLKKLMITTALSGLMIGSAFAAEDMNSSSPAPGAKSTEMTQSASPSMTQPASPSMTQPASPSTSANSASMPASSAKFVNSQRQDQYLASKFKGTDVIGSDDKKIGDVSDILFDKDGKIEAYVVGVGGFLGIGSKDVALAPNAFQLVPGDKSKNESDKLRLSMTKDELTQASNFEPYRAPSSTTGMGASPTRPLGSPGSPK